MNPFKRKQETVGENEAFVHLLRAAQEDAEFRATLCAILKQPSFHRQSLLNTVATGMSADGAEKNLVQAISALSDDAIAEQALQLLLAES